MSDFDSEREWDWRDDDIPSDPTSPSAPVTESPVLRPRPELPPEPAQPEPSPPEKSGDSMGAFLRELPVLLLVAFVLAFLLRTFVVQVFYIPSSSMEPTLQVHDRMIVEKITYRFREPHRGEIVVFEGEEIPTDTNGQNLIQKVARGVGQFLGVVPANARDFVKRVIGLPGDSIEIREGVVHVNGVALDEPYVVNEDIRSHGPYVVPEGKLFFLGDNRPNSSDSRFPRLGYVDMDNVVGRAVTIIWPLSHAGMLRGADYGEIPAADAPAASRPSEAAAGGRDAAALDRPAA